MDVLAVDVGGTMEAGQRDRFLAVGPDRVHLGGRSPAYEIRRPGIGLG